MLVYLRSLNQEGTAEKKKRNLGKYVVELN